MMAIGREAGGQRRDIEHEVGLDNDDAWDDRGVRAEG